VGLILDSTVVILAERRGHSVKQILEQFKADFGEIEVGLSVVTIWQGSPFQGGARPKRCAGLRADAYFGRRA
jgi:transposase